MITQKRWTQIPTLNSKNSKVLQYTPQPARSIGVYHYSQMPPPTRKQKYLPLVLLQNIKPITLLRTIKWLNTWLKWNNLISNGVGGSQRPPEHTCSALPKKAEHIQNVLPSQKKWTNKISQVTGIGTSLYPKTVYILDIWGVKAFVVHHPPPNLTLLEKVKHQMWILNCKF